MISSSCHITSKRCNDIISFHSVTRHWKLVQSLMQCRCCKSVDEILKCDHANESHWIVLPRGVVFVPIFGDIELKSTVSARLAGKLEIIVHGRTPRKSSTTRMCICWEKVCPSFTKKFEIKCDLPWCSAIPSTLATARSTCNCQECRRVLKLIRKLFAKLSLETVMSAIKTKCPFHMQWNCKL